MSNLETVLAVFKTLDVRQRLALAGVFVLMAVTAVLETLNIALLLPLIQSAMGSGAGSGSLGLLSTLGLEDLIRGLSGSIGEIAIIVFGVYLAKSALIGMSIYTQARFTAHTRAYFTVRLARGFAKRSYEDHIDTNSAHAVHDISQTAPSVVGSVLASSMGIAMEVLLASGAVMALFLLDPVSAVVAATFVVTGLTLYYVAIRGITYELGDKTLRLAKRQSQVSHFFIGATKESKVLQREKYFVDLISGVAQSIARVNTLASFIGQLPRLFGELIIIGAMVCVTLVIIEQRGSTEAALPILAVFAAAAFRVMPSTNRIVHYFSSFRQTAPLMVSIYPDLQRAADNYEELADAPEPTNGILTTSIILDAVSYKYPGASAPSIRDISLTIRKGEAVGFVGQTGSGKSTVVDVLLGLLEPTRGVVLVDGKNVHETPRFWRGKIGYVPQSVYLMDDTLRRNIAIGVPDELISDIRIEEVVRASRLKDVVGSLSAGLDTQIGEAGIKLSGGQRQRIGIARALYSDPEILVMDEATSALDNATESEISAAIKELVGEKTLILIAHRLSTVQNCDQLFFLEDGKLTAQGTYETLISDHEPFRRLAGAAAT